jgi:hypothetical protein
MKLKNYMSDARAVFSGGVGRHPVPLWCANDFLSFSDYDKTNGLKITWLDFGALPVSGLISLVAGAGLFFHTRLNYKKGVEIKRGGLSIIIKAQKPED